MTLANIQGKLSRAEMKNIMAGTGGTGCYKCCRSNGVCSECSFSYSGATCPEAGNTLTKCDNPC